MSCRVCIQEAKNEEEEDDEEGGMFPPDWNVEENDEEMEPLD